MKVMARKIENGFIVKQPSCSDDGYVETAHTWDDIDTTETDAIVSVLHNVSEALGASWGKRELENIKIYVAPGYDYGSDIPDKMVESMVDTCADLLSALTNENIKITQEALDKTFAPKAVRAALDAYLKAKDEDNV